MGEGEQKTAQPDVAKGMCVGVYVTHIPASESLQEISFCFAQNPPRSPTMPFLAPLMIPLYRVSPKIKQGLIFIFAPPKMH